MAKMELTAARRGRVFGNTGLMSVKIGMHRMVAGRCNSRQRLLHLGEKGVYPSYTLYPRILDSLLRRSNHRRQDTPGKPRDAVTSSWAR